MSKDIEIVPNINDSFSPGDSSWEIDFLKLCEKTNVVGEGTGWSPVHVKKPNSFIPGYVKGHSYGEFIFDWAWADLYQRLGKQYYPKLLHAIPFTPVNAKKVWGDSDIEGVQAAIGFYSSIDDLSSHHWLFTDSKLNSLLEANGYFIQDTLQYHWKKRWHSFDEFLQSLKMRKRKQIKKERNKVRDYGLEISWKPGNEVSSLEMGHVYNLYLSTIDKKHSHAYLNEQFFLNLPSVLKENFLLCQAKDGDRLVAMSMFFKSSSTLYGRYWGILPECESQYSCLHFEMCYYQGMDFCFANNLSLFEAGAQGEQKLLRGFEPVTIKSAHHVRDPQLGEIIKRHVSETNLQMKRVIKDLALHLPYKNS